MDTSREWMYNRLDGRYLSRVFVEKVEEFIKFACEQEEFQRCYKLKCPCIKCRNVPYHDVDMVKLHLYRKGFHPNYYRWVHHGEPFLEEEVAAPSSTCSSTAPITANGMSEMAKQLNRRPSAAELFAATHSKMDEHGQRVWCDAYAKSIYKKYEQLKLGTDVQDRSEADDHLFFKACGGWSDKGIVYGFGREAPSIYERPARRGTSCTSSTYSPSFVARLQERLSTTEEELRMIREELGSTRQELGSPRQELEATKKILEDQRLAIIELNARFDSFSSILGHPTRAGSSDPSC